MTNPGHDVPSDRSPPRDEGAASAHSSEAKSQRTGQPTRWQFGLPALLGTMMLLCLPFAIWGAILRANEDEQLVWLLVCIATPLGVLMLVALFVWLRSFLGSLRRAKEAQAEDWPDSPS